jgi:anti-anti-sigma regulatory factor
MLLTSDEEPGVLSITGSLDISTAGALRDALRDHMARYPEPALDLSRVEACDAATLQLFWSAQRTAAEAGKPFRVSAWSAAILEAGAALGLPFEELGGDTSGL